MLQTNIPNYKLTTHNQALEDLKVARARIKELESYADDSMVAMDIAQAHIRLGGETIYDKPTVLGMLDESLRENPLGWERLAND